MEHKILFFIESQWPLLLGAVALIIMIFKGPLTRRAVGIHEVDPATAVQLINHEDAVIIDVREQKEWSQGHLPGARHIPLGDRRAVGAFRRAVGALGRGGSHHRAARAGNEP